MSPSESSSDSSSLLSLPPGFPPPTAFTFSAFEPPDVSRISGNTSDEVKAKVADPRNRRTHSYRGERFGDAIGAKIEITDVSVVEDNGRLVGKVVCELPVEEGMVNGFGTLHGGCAVLLIDVCSALSIRAYKAHTGKKPGTTGVSQAINTTYHSPAAEGEVLRIVNTSITVGNRVMSAETEIWSKTTHRLVVSGVHIKMEPSQPPIPKAKL